MTAKAPFGLLLGDGQRPPPGRRVVRARVIVALVVAVGVAASAMIAVGVGGRVSATGSVTLKPVTLMLAWTPQSQFAGYYVAKAKGFYAEHGLDVTILPGGPDRDVGACLEDGQADFAIILLAGALIYRDRGIPVVNVGQIVNRSNLMLVAWKDTGITDVGDLQGRSISLWGEAYAAAYLGWLRGNGVTPTIKRQNTTINLFLRRGVDACAAMYYNEYHMLYQSGVDESEVVPFFLRDSEFDFPEDGIYCLETVLARDPDVARAMAEASLEGWTYAAEHEEEALDIVMARVEEGHVPTNRVHQKWMLETIVKSIIPTSGDGWRFGVLSADDYTSAADTLHAQGLVGQPAPSFEVFRPKTAVP